MAGWDPTTGTSINDEEFAQLISAANSHTTHAPLAQAPPEVSDETPLQIRLVDAAGATLGTFHSNEKHAAASRVCAFLETAHADCRVTVSCGPWQAIVLRHPNGNSIQASFLWQSSPHAPAVLTYPAAATSRWAEDVCSMLLFSHRIDAEITRLLAVDVARKLEQVRALEGQLQAVTAT
jgi:hypothetical protein